MLLIQHRNSFWSPAINRHFCPFPNWPPNVGCKHRIEKYRFRQWILLTLSLLLSFSKFFFFGAFFINEEFVFFSKKRHRGFLFIWIFYLNEGKFSVIFCFLFFFRGNLPICNNFFFQFVIAKRVVVVVMVVGGKIDRKWKTEFIYLHKFGEINTLPHTHYADKYRNSWVSFIFVFGYQFFRALSLSFSISIF